MYSIEEFDKQKSKVMNYIMYKKRTEKEVKNKFQSTCAEDLLCDIITYIKEAGYLNDNDYVQRAVNEFMALKNLSIKEIKYKLYSKGAAREAVENYFYKYKEEIEEYERKSAYNIYVKKENTMEKEDIENYLKKKGYKQEIISEILAK